MRTQRESGLGSDCLPLFYILLLTHVLFKTCVIRNLALGRNLSCPPPLKIDSQICFLRSPDLYLPEPGSNCKPWLPFPGSSFFGPNEDHSFHRPCDGKPLIGWTGPFLPDPPFVPGTWSQECQAGIFRRAHTLFPAPKAFIGADYISFFVSYQ